MLSTASRSDSAGVITYTGRTPEDVPMSGVSWVIDDLSPGEFREIDIVAE